MVFQIDQRYKVVVTDFKDDEQEIIGFVHPISNQLYIYQKDYFNRLQICEKFGFKWKCQSHLRLVNDIGISSGLMDTNSLKAKISERDREMYINYPISQVICRADDDKYLSLVGKP